MIKLYDFELSGSCYKIRMFLNILGQRYEPMTVDFVNKESWQQAKVQRRGV